MLNILVVEDNILIREEIVKIIKSEKDKFASIYDACDGQEAIEILKKNKIDVVLTDIKMPIINGIELIAYIRQHFENIRCIVISAFDDFEYVSEAFKLGAVNYILKFDLDRDSVIGALTDVENFFWEREISNNEIVTQIKAVKQLSELEDSIKSNIALRNTFFKLLLFNSISISDVDKEALYKYYRKYLIEKHIVIVIVIHQYLRLLKEEWDNRKELLNYAIFNVISEIAQEEKIGDAFFINDGEFVLLYNSPNNNKSEVFQAINRFFSHVYNAMQFCFSLKITIGYYDKKLEQAQIMQAYENAKLASNYYFINGIGRLYTYIESDDETINQLVYQKTMAIKDFIKEPIQFEVEQLKINWQSDAISSEALSKCKKIYENYYFELLNFIEGSNIKAEKIKRIFLQYTQFLKDDGTIQTLNNWIVDLCDEI